MIITMVVLCGCDKQQIKPVENITFNVSNNTINLSNPVSENHTINITEIRCERGFDCGENQFCYNNTCVEVECSQRSDCPEGFMCYIRQQICSNPMYGEYHCDFQGDNTCRKWCFNDNECPGGACSDQILVGSSSEYYMLRVCKFEN